MKHLEMYWSPVNLTVIYFVVWYKLFPFCSLYVIYKDWHFCLQKHNKNKSNYVELAGFEDRLTVMPVPVPQVIYSDVKVDLR